MEEIFNALVSFLSLPELYLLISLLIAQTFLFKYLQKYFDKKGENLAQKEDLQEITEIVENVKKEFHSELEVLKSHLAIATNTKIDLIFEEKKALLNYYASYFEWVEVFHNALNKYENNSLLDEYNEFIDKKYSEVCKLEALFDLFINDKDLILIQKDLKALALKKYRPLIIKIYGDVSILNIKIEDFENKSKPTTSDVEEYKDLTEKRLKLIKDFHRNRVDIHNELKESESKFKDKCKKYLRQLSLIQN